MDGLISLKEYISKPRKCPMLVAWKGKELLNHKLHHSWPSLLQNHDQRKEGAFDIIVPAQIDQDPGSYYLSPVSESTSDGSPVEQADPISPTFKSEPELPSRRAFSAAPSPPSPSHFLPQHSPTSSPASKQRRRKQREDIEEAKHEPEPTLTPEIVVIEPKPKIPEIRLWPPEEPSPEEKEDELSPLPEPFDAAHSPSDRGRPRPRVGSRSRSRRTPPRVWGSRFGELEAIPEEGSGDGLGCGRVVVGLGIA